jgi:NDP-4-keto-2,6-dideoxyhexose 3-C-methyltransferase
MKLLTLGSHYVSDFVEPDYDLSQRQKYSLDVYLDPVIGAGRLNQVVPSDQLWGKYWYRSGTNSSMTTQLQEIVQEVTKRLSLQEGDVWLDIACNDGTLLKHVPSHITKVGIDPADDSYLVESSKVATVVQDYFTADAYYSTPHGHKKPKVITCVAMFYDLNDPRPFIQHMHEILDDTGVVVLQMSYTPLMLKQLAFDNICHEHVYYYDLTSIKTLFESEGFQVVDCSLNDTNGGSFRIYLMKQSANTNHFGTAPLRDVCEFRVSSLLQLENGTWNIRDSETWNKFSQRLDLLRDQTLDFLSQARHKGKVVYGYGASTKGNTLLQLFGIDSTLVKGIAERSPYKFGKQTVATHIPIVSEEQMRVDNPDYLLILPWHFINEFLKREHLLLASGTKFIVPCPKFEVFSA